jgi:hypothetical protein
VASDEAALGVSKAAAQITKTAQPRAHLRLPDPDRRNASMSSQSYADARRTSP